jgi:Ca-activated chloride channel family protein
VTHGKGYVTYIAVAGFSALWLSGAGLARAGTPVAGYAGTPQTPTIRADVNLVQVQVKVTDTHGRIIPDLEKQAFELLVDDARQEITVFQGEDAPVTAGIVVDNSASMAPKRKDVIAAATEFARDSNPLDEMFVLHFNDRARLGLPQGQPFTGSVEELQAAISKFQLGGTTALYDALTSAMTHLNAAAYTRRVLLAITDGGDNSSTAQPPDVVNAAGKSGTQIFAVGIFDNANEDRNPSVLKQIAENTGGEAFFPQSSTDVPGLCKQIAREIRHEYTLGFAGATDGKYHSIQVLVHDPNYGKLQAHSRSGYQAAGKTE